MNTKKILVCALAGAFAGAAHAAPTSGAYVNDVQRTWVQDRVGDRISTVNMIMCIMSNMRPESFVNQGPYIALVSQEKCKGQSSASNASTTNSGEANSTNYMSAVVESTQLTEADPLTMKAWISDEEEHDGQTEKTKIYVYLEATEGKSDAHPNGLFRMYFCGVPDMLGAGCMMKGTLKSDADGLTFYEAEQGGGGGPQETKLRMQQTDSNGDNGAGKIQGFEQGGPYAYTFAYDPTYFRRSDGTGDVCFIRDKNQAETSTWRYGTYKDDGSHLEVSHPGFPVKFVDGDNTAYGYWGFWGLSLPPTALARVGADGTTLTRHVGDADETLTVNKQGGKLWKLSRQRGTLNDFKNIQLNYGACQTTAHLPANGDPQCTNYTLQWNGAVLQAVGKNVCDNNGCNPQSFDTPIDLSASEFAAVGMNSVNIYSPSGDGVIRVGQTEFNGDTELFYRSRNMVMPGSSDAPAQLVCVNNCPAPYANTNPLQPWLDITALSWGGSSTQTISSSQNWGPVPTANALGYTYDGMLKSAGTTIDYSGASQSQMGNFMGGLQSGFLIDASDTAALASVKCDNNGAANPSGNNYCPWLSNEATTSYQWETGPNQWNQYFGASNDSGPITFDPPRNLSFAVAADSSNIRIRTQDITKYAGSTLQLQYAGFGELQGIPGACVDADSNLPVPCGPNVRWVPAFDIVDGSVVTESSNSYWLKYLEREMRLAKAQGGTDTTCKTDLPLTSADSLTLPDATEWDVNPKNRNGAEPTPASSEAAVIQGVLQN